MQDKQSNEIIEIARAQFNETLLKYTINESLGDIWESNIDLCLSELIQTCETPTEAMDYLNDRAFYDVACPQPYLSHAIDWKIKLLQRSNGVELNRLPIHIQESVLISDANTTLYENRKISSDFLFRLSLYFRTMQSVNLPEHATIIELGGGYGALMRVFKLYHPNTSCVFVDLPETLFFANIYIRSNFPDAKILYVEDETSIISNIKDYDFVLVPFMLTKSIEGCEVDLFLNTNSLGEMPKFFIKKYFDLLQNSLNVNYFASLNRFFNRITERFSDRCDIISPSLQYDEHWDVLDWEISPDFDNFPFIETLITRNMFAVTKRNKLTVVELDEKIESTNVALTAVKFEDWHTKAYWDNYELKFNGEYPRSMSKSDRDLTPNLTETGSLFTIWNNLRYSQSNDTRLMLIKYLDYLAADGQFEEVFQLRREYICQKLSLISQEKSVKIGLLSNVNIASIVETASKGLFDSVTIYSLNQETNVLVSSKEEDSLDIKDMDEIYLYNNFESENQVLINFIFENRLSHKLKELNTTKVLNDIKAAEKIRSLLESNDKVAIWGAGSDLNRVLTNFPKLSTASFNDIFNIYDKNTNEALNKNQLIIHHIKEIPALTNHILITSQALSTQNAITSEVEKLFPKATIHYLYK